MDSRSVEAASKVNIRGRIFEKFWSKNDVPQIDPGSLWEGPGTSRAPKNIKGMTKHPLGGVRKDVQKLSENLMI